MNLSNGTLPPEIEVPRAVHPVVWIGFLVGYALVVLTTIGGNVVVIASYVRNKFVRATVANVYILNLSISDILVASIVMLCDFFNLVLGRWPFGDILCAVWLSIHYFAVYMSVVTVMVISIDRLWLISDILRYKRLQKHFLARVVVAVIWIYTILYTALYSTSTEDIVHPSTRRGGSLRCLVATQNTNNMLLSIILENLDFAIPLVLLIGVNITVGYKIYQQLNNPDLVRSHPKRRSIPKEDNTAAHISMQTLAIITEIPGNTEVGIVNISEMKEYAESSPGELLKNREQFHNEKNVLHVEAMDQRPTKKDRPNATKRKESTKFVDQGSVARNLLLLTTVYTACWLPYHILVFLQTWQIYQAPPVVWEVLQRLIWFNSMVNPFLYAKMNMRFRLGMLTVLCYRKNFQERINRLIIHL